MAEGVGFEPTLGFLLIRFSRPARSTALPPLRGYGMLNWIAFISKRVFLKVQML